MQGKEDLDFMDFAHRLEHRLSALMARSGVTATRVALGIIFLWFGILKFLPTTTPIDVLAERALTMITFHQFTAEHCLHVLAVWECVIAIGLLSGRFLRFTLLLLFLQLPWDVPAASPAGSRDVGALPLLPDIRRAIHYQEHCSYRRWHYRWFHRARGQNYRESTSCRKGGASGTCSREEDSLAGIILAAAAGLFLPETPTTSH